MKSGAPDPIGMKRASAMLRLISTTDLHMHICAYDYYADKPSEEVGLSRAATLIRQARNETTNSLLFDNGDALQGSPLGDYAAQRTQHDTHPMIRAMQALDYDAASLGNHDFDFGLDTVEAIRSQAPFPFVCANLVRRLGDTPTQDDPFAPPFAVLDRFVEMDDGSQRPLKVGVIGFLPPQVMIWDRDHLAPHLTARDIVDAAAAHVPALRAVGADIVVALAHSGFDENTEAASSENAIIALAAVPGIDAIIAGHVHGVFPGDTFRATHKVDPRQGKVHGVPTVMAGACGSHIGVIDLNLHHDGQAWNVRAATCQTRPIAERKAAGSARALVPADGKIEAVVHSDHTATVLNNRKAVGITPKPLHTFFALCADSAAVRLVAMAQQAYAEEQLRGSTYANWPILSASAPFKVGARGGPDHFTHVPAGRISLSHVADLYPFENRLSVLAVTGRTVRDWLERSASIFETITPNRTGQMLISPDAVGYNFDAIYGLTYQIDLTRPALFGPGGKKIGTGPGRIRDLAYQGAPVEDQAQFLVATNAYRANGGGYFAPKTPDSEALCSTTSNREVLRRFIERVAKLNIPDEKSWTLRPIPGAGVTWRTAPRALDYLDELSEYVVTPLDRDSDGFQRLRMTFRE